MSKYFLINPNKGESSKEIIVAAESEKQQIGRLHTISLNEKSTEQLAEEDNLIHVEGRVVVKVDMLFKNSHTFSDGTQIKLERQFNNFNRRETQPVNAVVISGDSIPKNSEILISHNALHETNRINNYKTSFEHEDSDRVRYYSLPESDCFAWKDSDGEYHPMKNYAFGLRVFKPYTGIIAGIEPSLIKNVLYITTGHLSGNVCHTLIASDYTIIFQGADGREKQLIRIRHSEDETFDREEIVAVDHGLTGKVNSGELLIGLTSTTSKKLSDG